MNAAFVIAGAAVADAVAGDPAWIPHPVRVFGLACTVGERFARRFTRDDATRELIAGGLVAAAIVMGAYAFPKIVLARVAARDERAGFMLAIAFAWTTLAARDLLVESASVLAALEAGDLLRARARVARIVGRDTAHLDAREIARATIETLAESACDGIVAPLCALAIGGVPLAFAFKAASTLDSMIGHIEAPYTNFGRVAARLDDVACYVPARLTAFAICAVAPLVARPNVRAISVVTTAFATWRRDGGQHASPNAGQSEAAMAGALTVSLGGTNTYDGIARATPILGAQFARATVDDIARARRTVAFVTVGCTIAFAALRALRDRRFKRRGRPDAS